jgi:hypothetical protein
VFFRAGNFAENPKGVTDSLRNDLNRYLALNPTMPWKDIIPPNPIQNLTFGKLPSGQAGLKWDLPQTASDGDSAYRYVVYRFDSPSVNTSDLEDSKNIYNVEGSRQSVPLIPASSVGPSYFVVTALDRNYNESSISQIINVTEPTRPNLISPINNEPSTFDTIHLKWSYPKLASFFRLQISIDSTFSSGMALDQNNLIDSFKVVTGLNGQTKYYWRVNCSNAAGISDFSNINSFTTGFPPITFLCGPSNFKLSVPLDTILYWEKTPYSETYNLQLANAQDFSSSSIIVNKSSIEDTFYLVNNLEPTTLYFWKVRANNQYGYGGYSSTWRFRTVNLSSINVEKEFVSYYALEQNYPNPFNPETTIRIKIANYGLVTVIIYNLLGQEVARLANDYLTPGVYDLKFNGSKLSSGVYIYRMRVNDFSTSKKMILMK